MTGALDSSFLKEVASRAILRYHPPPIDVWVGANRFVAAGPFPGFWRHDRVAAALEPLQAFSRDGVREIVVSAPVQMMKTELIINIALYCLFLDYEIVLYEPDKNLLTDMVRTRIRPSLGMTPALVSRLKKEGTASGRSSRKQKHYDSDALIQLESGGRLTMLSPNQITGLAARSPRVVLVDEVGKMGRFPMQEIQGRLTAWEDRGRLVAVSSPGLIGQCEITDLWWEGSRGEFHARCPHCRKPTPLTFSCVKIATKNGKWVPERSHFVSECCGRKWSEADRQQAVGRGLYVHNEPNNPRQSFRCSGFANPFLTLPQILAEGSAALVQMKELHDPTSYRIWHQERLGQPWDEGLEGVNAAFAQSLTWQSPLGDELHDEYVLPEAAQVITVGCDVGELYICGAVVAWGLGSEGRLRAWGLRYFEVRAQGGENVGDASLGERFAQELGKRAWVHPRWGRLPLAKVLIDAGYRTDAVIHFCQNEMKKQIQAGFRPSDQRFGWRFLPCRGAERLDADIVRCPESKKVPGRVVTGGHVIKDWLFETFAQAKANPGDPDRGLSFAEPLNATGHDAGFFESLTNERKRREYDRLGRAVYRYHKIVSHRPNEALDCWVYARGALETLAARGRMAVEAYLAEIIKQRRAAAEAGKKDGKVLSFPGNE